MYHYFFDLTSLEARAEILTKISLFFWWIWRHQKNISKLTDKKKRNWAYLDMFQLFVKYFSKPSFSTLALQ